MRRVLAVVVGICACVALTAAPGNALSAVTKANPPATRIVTAAPGPTHVKPTGSNTGVPRGTTLRARNGDLVIRRPGAIIDRMDIRGSVVIKAPNVIIKRSIIRGGNVRPSSERGLLTITSATARNYRIDGVTIAPRFASPYFDGVKVAVPGVFNRINVSGTVDGFKVYGNGITIVNSYLHRFLHFARDPNHGGGPSHDDSIQVQGGAGISIINNTVEGAKGAGIMVTQDHSVTRNLAIVSNWIDGGGCSINFKSNGPYKRGMRVVNNRFGSRQSVAKCAIIHNAARSDLRPVGNTWIATGLLVQASRGS